MGLAWAAADREVEKVEWRRRGVDRDERSAQPRARRDVLTREPARLHGFQVEPLPRTVLGKKVGRFRRVRQRGLDFDHLAAAGQPQMVEE